MQLKLRLILFALFMMGLCLLPYEPARADGGKIPFCPPKKGCPECWPRPDPTTGRCELPAPVGLN